MTETAVVMAPNIEAVEAKINPLVRWASTLELDSNDALEYAERQIVAIGEAIKFVEAEYRPTIEQAHKLHKMELARLNKYAKPLAEARSTAKLKTGGYRARQEAERRREEEELGEKARQQEEERQLLEAVRLEREGHTEAAEEVIQRPVDPPTVVVQSSVPKASGVQYRTNWKCRIVDKAKIPLEYLEPNMQALGQLARTLKGEAKVEGVEFYSEQG